MTDTERTEKTKTETDDEGNTKTETEVEEKEDDQLRFLFLNYIFSEAANRFILCYTYTGTSKRLSQLAWGCQFFPASLFSDLYPIREFQIFEIRRMQN